MNVRPESSDADVHMVMGRHWLAGQASPVRLPFKVSPGIRRLAGPISPQTGAALAAAVDIVERCALWTAAYIAPAVESNGDGMRGVCPARHEVIAIALGSRIVCNIHVGEP